jgi:flagellar hook assembly protein FlgD
MRSGEYTVQWHGDNDNGRTVSNGVYFIKLQSGDETAVRKGLMLK